MPAGESLEALRGTIPEEEYKDIHKFMRECIKMSKDLNKDGKEQEEFLIGIADYPAYRLVFDKDQKLLRFTKSWY